MSCTSTLNGKRTAICFPGRPQPSSSGQAAHMVLGQTMVECPCSWSHTASENTKSNLPLVHFSRVLQRGELLCWDGRDQRIPLGMILRDVLGLWCCCCQKCLCSLGSQRRSGASGLRRIKRLATARHLGMLNSESGAISQGPFRSHVNSCVLFKRQPPSVGQQAMQTRQQGCRELVRLALVLGNTAALLACL